MWQIGQLEIENFRLIHNAVVTLNTLGLVYVGGVNNDVKGASSNMSGKSTLCSAITWCTHGVDITGSALSGNVVSNGQKMCRVVLGMHTSNFDHLRIERARSRSTNSLKVTVKRSGKKQRVYQGKPSEVQGKIDALLGNARMFIAAHVFGYDEATRPFAIAGDNEQKKLFDCVIDSEDLDRALGNARNALADARDWAVRCEERHNSATTLLKSERAAQRSTDSETQDHLAVLQDALARCNVDVKKTLRDVRKKKASLERAKNGLNMTKKDYNDAVSAPSLLKAKDDASMAVSRLRVAEEAMKSLQGRKTCPTCCQPVPGKHRKRLERAHQGLIRAKNAALAVQTELMSALQVSALETRIRRKEKTVAHAMEEHRIAVNEVNAATRQRQSVEQQMKRAQEVAAKHAVKRGRNLVKSVLNVLRLGRAVADSMQQVADIEFWVEGFGPRGIRAYRLDRITPVLNAYAASYADVLFGDGTTVRYATQSRTKLGGIRERFAVKVVDKTGTEVETLSAGQALRRDIIHTFSMIALAKSLGKRTMDIVIFDEAFRTLDAKGVDGVIMLLRSLAQNVGTVMVIEHNDELRSRFQQAITVERTGGSSTVVIE